MWVTGLVGVLVMEAMGRDPKERAALQCERAADGQGAFEPPRCLVSAMGEQAVVAHAYAPPARDPEQRQCDPERLPSEQEECRQRSCMKQREGDDRDQVQ